MHWRVRWELEAGREAESLSELSEDALLENINNGRLGNYYQIWRVIGAKGTRQNSAVVLWQFLQQHPGDDYMLHRYHCANALLTILELHDDRREKFKHRIQWDHDGEQARQDVLIKLIEIIDRLQS